MTDNAFDAAGFIRVNLETGTIESSSQTPLVVIPTEVLAALAPNDEVRQAARAWGEHRGRVFAEVANPQENPLDLFAQHLQGEVAMMGMGRAGVDVLGDALVVKVEGAAAGDVVRAVLTQFTAGYVSALGSTAFETTVISDEDGQLQLFVGNSDAVSNVRTKISQGMSPDDAIAALHKEVA